MQRARGSVAHCRHGGSHVVTSPLHRGSLALSRRRRGATRKGRVCIRWELQNDVLLARAGSGMRGGRAVGGRTSRALPLCPQLFPPLPLPWWLLRAHPGWSWVGRGHRQTVTDMGMLSQEPGFQARLPLVPEQERAHLRGAKTLISPAAQGGGRCVGANPPRRWSIRAKNKRYCLRPVASLLLALV